MEKKDPLVLAQLMVRGECINFDSKLPFQEVSGIYRFTNENMTAYFHHLKNKQTAATVIGSGCQILNGVLAGIRSFDCFDISIFPEFYLFLQIGSVLALSKEDYLKYYFSEDKEELFGDDFYDKISEKLKGKYKEFWDTLYMFDDGVDIYNSFLFRHDVCLEKFAIENNPFLQDDNYEKLKQILQTESITINPIVADITKTRQTDEYDLVNLSNILSYNFRNPKEYVEFLKNNFSLTENGEIINYVFGMGLEVEKRMSELLQPNGYIEEIGRNKLLVYKK